MNPSAAHYRHSITPSLHHAITPATCYRNVRTAPASYRRLSSSGGPAYKPAEPVCRTALLDYSVDPESRFADPSPSRIASTVSATVSVDESIQRPTGGVVVRSTRSSSSTVKLP